MSPCALDWLLSDLSHDCSQAACSTRETTYAQQRIVVGP